VVDGGGRWKDHLAAAGGYLAGDPASVLEALTGHPGKATPSWTRLWRGAEAAARGTLTRELDGGAFFEGAAVARVARRCPPGALLFLSSSMPVRDMDAFVPVLPQAVPVLGNRGASGIDGIVSTAVGVSLGTGAHVVAVVGDLALIHDMNGLMALREEGIRVTLVVIQNDGGGIFHRLPIREYEPEFTRYFATPHGLEVSRIADLHGLPLARARTLEELDRALDQAAGWKSGGIVEVPTDRDGSMERSREVAKRVERAVEEHLDELAGEP
jgi:2-succinyl-5-enolpyruvyl-6-hydroxy-3-cyclohexene-1-carboxylate synthase